MRELVSGFISLGFSLFVLWESLRLGLGTLQKPGSGFFSFCAGSILGILSLTLIRSGWEIRAPEQAPSAKRAGLAMLSVIVYSFALEHLGFIVATFFLMAVLFYLTEPRRWRTILWMSALVTLLLYLVFGILLRVHFPRGVLGI